MDVLLEIMRQDSPVDDTPGKWRQGECVLVREFTAELRLAVNGVCHVPRKAYLIIESLPPLITDIQQIKDYMDREEHLLDDPTQPMISRRLWFTDIGSLNKPQRDSLFNPPYYLERTWAQAKGVLIKQKGTGRPLDDSDFGV